MTALFNLNGKNVPINSLKYKSKEDQIQVMRDWFYDNYENPAESCPYESREGGYAYIYGGPYDALEELQSMFEGFIKYSYIEELGDELQQECWEWSGNSNNSDWYDEDLYDAVTSSEEPFNKFIENIERIRSLSMEKYKDEQKDHLYSILYINVITVLETLYVELFIQSLEKDISYVIDCIEKGKTEFKVSKKIAVMPFKGVTIEKIREELIKEIKEHLISASWHSTNSVIKRYKATFEIKVHSNWPIDIIEMATQTRNHLVHRSGKDKDGNAVIITKENLDTLLENALSLGSQLYESLEEAIQIKAPKIDPEF
ncbi:hypothetical protein V5L11_004302 [Enterobacter hormaechei]|uniref:hypothetical protein n=1 Tax=Enterobacter kobei TaxID=208224 RepID=UPI002FC23072